MQSRITWNIITQQHQKSKNNFSFLQNVNIYFDFTLYFPKNGV